MGVLIVIALLARTRLVLARNDAADEAAATIRPEAIRADMRFLADDLLEGRGTGTRGHEIAAKFIASEFEAMGLEPAGDGGSYFQSVPLRAIDPDQEVARIVLAGTQVNRHPGLVLAQFQCPGSGRVAG
jgi:hypothetical protein